MGERVYFRQAKKGQRKIAECSLNDLMGTAWSVYGLETVDMGR